MSNELRYLGEFKFEDLPKDARVGDIYKVIISSDPILDSFGNWIYDGDLVTCILLTNPTERGWVKIDTSIKVENEYIAKIYTNNKVKVSKPFLMTLDNLSALNRFIEAISEESSDIIDIIDGYSGTTVMSTTSNKYYKTFINQHKSIYE